MKKFASITTITLALVFMLANQGLTAPVTLKLGHTLPPTHPFSQAALDFASDVAAKTNNEVQIEVYPASQLGGAKDLIEATIRGTQQIAFDGPGVVSQFLPKISILDMPFMFANYDELLKVFKSDFGQSLIKELEEKRHLKVLGMVYYGSRNVTSNKPIKSVADFKGLKIRTPEVQEWLKAFRALGASPTPIAFSEVYFSLQTGVVDAQENPLPTIDTYKFYEVQKHLVLTNHQVGSMYLMFNDKSWKALSADQQKIVQESVDSIFSTYTDKIKADESKLADVLAEKGMEVFQPSPKMMKEIKASVKAIFPGFKKKWGDDAADQIQKVLAQ
jgi:tripartite ATP-independent transporter DctP family solute receptor